MGHPAAEEPTEVVRALHWPKRLLAGENVVLAAPETEVDVAAGSGLVRERFGHERDAAAQTLRDLLHPQLHNGVPVGHRQDVGITDVHLMLAVAPLAFRVLDGDA